MKNILILHGCPESKTKGENPETRTYDKHWHPWAQEQFEARGVKTVRPMMPAPWTPVYEDFKVELGKYDVDEDSIIIAHSCGCAYAVRWLADTKQKIAKLILVAPWKISPDPDNEIKTTFYNFTVDETIKDRVKNIYMFTSDNEAEMGKESLKIFHDSIGGEIINLPTHGHFGFKHMRTIEFPELVDLVLS